MGFLVEGDQVLIQVPNGHIHRVILERGQTHSLGRYGTLRVDRLFDLESFDYFYDLENDQFHPHNPYSCGPQEDLEVEMLPNDCLTDDNTAQKLSITDISALKDTLTGPQVVDSLVAHSTSFEKKNAHAQVKYLRRKQEKYLKIVRILSVTAVNILKMMELQDKLDKIGYLREDSLAMINYLATNSGVVGVLDEFGGLIMHSLLEKRYSRNVIALYSGQQLNLPFCFNKTDSLESLKVSLLERDALVEPDANSNEKFLERWNRQKAAFDSVKIKGIDTLIIASSSPCSFLDQLGKFIAPSGMLLVYSPYREPLVPLFPCLLYGDSDGIREFLDVKLQESFLRRYQTDPGRLHPQMSMSGHTGTLLSAVRKDPTKNYT
jgi:tRNA (adenine58-N1)-methyltransferase non-catalytic subunit